MFTERTLLERLAQPRTAGRRTVTEDTAEVSRSVLRNLQNILNCRVGNAPAQMDLGMPAPSDITRAGNDTIERMVRELRACIEKYEPRLSDVDIAHVESEDDVLTLRFQVTARIATAKEEATLSFDTLVDPAGRIRVHE